MRLINCHWFGLAVSAMVGVAAASGAGVPRVAEWGAAPPLPTAVAGNAVLVDGASLVSMGGTSWSTGEKRWLSEVARWTPGATEWEKLDDWMAPTAHALAAPTAEGYVLLGGSESDDATATALRVTFDGRPVTEALPPLPAPTVLAAGGVIGTTAIVAGGTGKVSDIAGSHARVFTLDLADAKATWQPGPDLPGGPRSIAASATCGGELLVFGGCSHDGQAVVNRADAWAWSPGKKEWRKLADLPKAVRGASAIALDDRYVLIVGGYTDGFTADSLIYDVGLDRYEPTAPLPTAAGVCGIARIGDRVFIVGGEDKAMSRSALVYVGEIERSPSPRPEPGAALDPAKPIRIVCAGDSMTFGGGKDTSYPAQLEALVPEAWVVGNFGHNGVTAIRTTGRPYRSVPEFAAGNAFNPDVVVLMLGTNDAASTPDRRATYATDLGALIDHYRSLPTSPRVWVCTPPPLMPGRDDDRMRTLTEGIVPTIRAVAAEKAAPVIELHELAALQETTLYPDKVHLNPAGYGIVAAEVAKILTQP